MSTNNQQPQAQQQYSTPATFVNVKRVRLGDKDSKGRDKMTLTFGLGSDRAGNEVNNLNSLIAALEQYRDKQVNFTIHTEEKEDPQSKRKFPSAFIKITEMIPKDQQQGKVAFVPKADKKANVQANAAKIREQFNTGASGLAPANTTAGNGTGTQGA